MMYILNAVSAIKKMAMKKLSDSIYENYYSRIGFTEKDSYYSINKEDFLPLATKLIQKKTLILVKPKNTINLI